MTLPPVRRQPVAIAPLLAIGLAMFLVHLATNGQYGFHRDELTTLDDARHLAWGFVPYPPLTAFFGRISLELWGPSLRGIRVFPALAQSLVVVLTGCMAAELGATRRWQIVAALAALVAPVAVVSGSLYQYVSFDALCWVATAYFVIRVLRSDDPRWWLAVGLTVGLGMLAKYSMAFLVIGILVGLALTPARRHLASGWLWAGVALSLLIFLPHLIWEARHDFITITFLQHIHARDVRIGRADGFIVQQLYATTCILTVPLWMTGLWYLLAAPAGARFRVIGWMYVVALAILVVARGRFYYLEPGYPMLLAAGAVAWESWLRQRGELRGHDDAERAARVGGGIAVGVLAVVALASIAILPVGAPHGALWNLRGGLNGDYAEEIGWPELVRTVDSVYVSLPPAVRAHSAILAGNYGEAGAIDMYGPRRGLPQAISAVNTYWLRGPGNPGPESAIVLGYDMSDATKLFEHCDVVAHETNAHHVENEETRDHPDILFCTTPRAPWNVMWPRMLRYG